MLGHGPHVEDLAQEVFLRAFRAMPTFDPDGAAKPSTWLLTIATRIALDARKRRVIPLRPLEVDHEPDALLDGEPVADRPLELRAERLRHVGQPELDHLVNGLFNSHHTSPRWGQKETSQRSSKSHSHCRGSLILSRRFASSSSSLLAMTRHVLGLVQDEPSS